MKLIHCADLHLASPMESRLSPEKAKQRRTELYRTFDRIADYGVENGVSAILIAGDIFDESRPRNAEKKNFLKIVEAHPEVDFLCLSGNHDESLEDEENLPENVFCYGEDWKKNSYDEVDIWGCTQTDANFNLLYTTLRPDRTRINIVLLHGEVRQSGTPAYGTVLLPALRDKGIDYLALGHYHSFEEGGLDERGKWCYSGTPEGRGFDECGPKGFVLLNIENGELSSRFVPFAQREIEECKVDISGLEGELEIEERVLSALSCRPSKNILRVLLIGRVPLNAQIRPKELEGCLNERFFSSSVKNCTKIQIDPSLYRDELSLKGEFIRTVLAARELSEEEKEQVLRCGLLALEGEEAEFT